MNKTCSDSCFCVNSSDSQQNFQNPCNYYYCVDTSNCQKDDVNTCGKLCDINSPNYVECECRQNTKQIFIEGGLD